MINLEVKDKKSKPLQNKIVKSILNKLYQDGIITIEDMEDPIKLNEIYSQHNMKNSKKVKYELTIDHRDEILNQAKLLFDDILPDFSISLYATYIEHTLNRIIHLGCIAQNINVKTQIKIIKATNIDGKCTWILTLLKLPAIKEEHVTTILKVAEERNAFIHYKWKSVPDLDKIPDPIAIKNQNTDKHKKIISLIKYLKSYETRIEYNGAKQKIERALK